MTSPTVSRISESIATLPRNSGSKRSLMLRHLTAGQRRVVGDAGDAGLPRQVERRAVVPLLVEEAVLEVDPVGDAVERQLLDPAEVLEPGGHPVGRADDVVVDDAAGAEDRGQDPVVDLVVVVEVLVVGDGDAGLLGEAVERADGAVLGRVDVGLPVEDPDLAVAGADAALAAGGRPRRSPPAVARQRQHSADHDRRAGDGATGDQRPPSEAPLGRRRGVVGARRRPPCRRGPLAPRRRRWSSHRRRPSDRAAGTARRAPSAA